MFYCDTCAVAHRWPQTFHRSQGRCEVCGRTSVCNDLPSSELPSAPNYGRPPLTIVIAPSWQYFIGWCRVDCDPPEDPNDAKFVKFMGPRPTSHGARCIPGDLVYVLGDPLWSGVDDILRVLLTCGYTEYLNDDGMPLQIEDLLVARQVTTDFHERSPLFGRMPSNQLRIPTPRSFDEISADLPPGCHIEVEDATGGPPIIVIDTALVTADQIRAIRERYGRRADGGHALFVQPLPVGELRFLQNSWGAGWGGYREAVDAATTEQEREQRRHLYEQAQQADPWPGEDYDGTSLLDIRRAQQEMRDLARAEIDIADIAGLSIEEVREALGLPPEESEHGE